MTFSVIIPVFNTPPAILLEAVYSIIHQDYSDPFRFVLIDDCSTDVQTREALKLLSKRVELIRLDKNVGLAGLMNQAIELVDSDFIIRMDSDDISAPNRLSKQIKYLTENPETDVLGCNLFAFQNQDIHRKAFFTSSHQEEPVPKEDSENRFFIVNHATVIFRRQAVLDVGGYDESFRRKQDVELWSRMFEAGKVFRNVSSVLYGWRRYSEDQESVLPCDSSSDSSLQDCNGHEI